MAGALVIAGLHAANPANALERLLAMTPTADALAEALRLIAVVSTVDVFETVEEKKRKTGNRMIAEVVPISAKSQSNLRRTGNHAKLIELIKEKEGYLSVAEIIARLEKQGLEFDEKLFEQPAKTIRYGSGSLAQQLSQSIESWISRKKRTSLAVMSFFGFYRC